MYGKKELLNKPRQERDENQFPNGDDFSEGEPSECKRQNHRSRLRPNHAALPVVAVPDVSPNRREEKNRHLAGESEDSQQRRGTRQLIYQPKLRGGLHPRADERNELAPDEQLKVPMLQGAEARGHGRADRGAVTLQNILPPLVGCRDRELFTMPRVATPCQREGIRIPGTISPCRGPPQRAAAPSAWCI